MEAEAYNLWNFCGQSVIFCFFFRKFWLLWSWL